MMMRYLQFINRSDDASIKSIDQLPLNAASNTSLRVGWVWVYSWDRCKMVLHHRHHHHHHNHHHHTCGYHYDDHHHRLRQQIRSALAILVIMTVLHPSLYPSIDGSIITIIAISLTVVPAAIALAHSWMRSAAWIPMMCTPTISSVSLLYRTWRWIMNR